MWKIHKTLPGAQADVTPHLPSDSHAWKIVVAWPSIDVDDGSGDLPGSNSENGDQLSSAPGAPRARAGAKHNGTRLDHLDHLSPLDSLALDAAQPLASNGSIVAEPGAALDGTHGAAGMSDGAAAAGATVSAKSGPRRARGRQLQQVLSSLAIAAIILAAAACIALTLPGAWVMVGAALIGLSITTQHRSDEHKLLTMMLGATVGVAALDYLTWRLEMTNWAGWWIAVPLLAAEIFGALHTLGLHYTVWPRPQPQVAPSEDPTRRPIFIFIPTVNEGPTILAPTIQAACEARRRYLEVFPQGRVSIVVCNDGRVANAANWRDTEQLAHRLEVMCVTRTVGGGAKAGNLEHARRQVGATDNALVVIFDADQIARPDFLLKTVPPFADPTVGWVQTGQYYRNLDQPVARWANDQQALFYRILCPGKAAHNAVFICGTNVVVRAAALDQIGGLPQDSVTEDFAASIQLHPTWRSLFLSTTVVVVS